MTYDVIARFLGIFSPFILGRQKAVRESGTRFVYYTTAHTAAQIICKREFWMRSVTTMNDYMEAQHGLRCLQRAYGGEPGNRLRRVLGPHFPNLLSRLEKLFDQWSPHFLTDTYITCVSEHLSSEDTMGRLSMWRAYGSGSGIALVLNNAPLLNETDALKAYAVPVSYMNEESFRVAFGSMVDRLSEDLVFVRGQGEEVLLIENFVNG